MTRSMEHVEALVVGGDQAGPAVNHELTLWTDAGRQAAPRPAPQATPRPVQRR